MKKLENKTIIITGASSGIGSATAKLLASHGAQMVIAARREDRLKELKKEIEEEGGSALIVTTDVSKRQDMEVLVQKSLDEYGNIDVMINNAGIMPMSFIKNLKVDEWERTIDVNLKGTMFGVAAVLPHMLEKEDGHIVNLCSILGRKAIPGAAIYCATKFGIQAFCDSLRQELTPTKNIRITAIEPGGVNTEIDSTITDEEMKKFTNETRNRGMLEAIDIAEGILYAISQPPRVDVSEVLIMPSVETKF